MENNVVTIDVNESYTKRYVLRRTGNHGNTYETSIPKEVLEREAKRLGVALSDIFEKYDAVWHYGSFNGLYLTIEEKLK